VTCVFQKCGISHKENSSQAAKNVLKLFSGGSSELVTILKLTTAPPFVLKISNLGACRGKTQESKKI